MLSYLPRNSRFRPGLEAETDAGRAKQDAADKVIDDGNEKAHDARIARRDEGQGQDRIRRALKNARDATREIEDAEKRDREKELVELKGAHAIRKAVDKQRFEKNELTGKLLGNEFFGEAEAALLEADPSQRKRVRGQIGQAARQS